MSIESAIKSLLVANTTLNTLAAGGIHTSEEVGPNGLSSEYTSGILDSNKDVLLCLFIKSRDFVNDGQISDFDSKDVSGLAITEIYIYQEKQYDKIEQAEVLIKNSLQGQILTGTFELEWILTAKRLTDGAALAGASMERMDWSLNVVF